MFGMTGVFGMGGLADSSRFLSLLPGYPLSRSIRLPGGPVCKSLKTSGRYKMGIVSGADSHSAYSNNEEFNFHGSHGVADDTPQKRLNPGMNPSRNFSPPQSQFGFCSRSGAQI
jgi:hypothetical protein